MKDHDCSKKNAKSSIANFKPVLFSTRNLGCFSSMLSMFVTGTLAQQHNCNHGSWSCLHLPHRPFSASWGHIPGNMSCTHPFLSLLLGRFNPGNSDLSETVTLELVWEAWMRLSQVTENMDTRGMNTTQIQARTRLGSEPYSGLWNYLFTEVKLRVLWNKVIGKSIKQNANGPTHLFWEDRI